MQNTYQANTNITFRLGARQLYQTAGYGTVSAKATSSYINSSSTYNFKDVKANELVLPNSMAVSCSLESDARGMYIDKVPSNLFYPYRKYQLVINVNSKTTSDTIVLPESFQVEAP